MAVKSAPRRTPCQAGRFEDHGAVGDGVADDTHALAAALSTAPLGSRLAGRPGATYRITEPITATLEDVSIDLCGSRIRIDFDLEPGASAVTFKDCVALCLRGGSMEAPGKAKLANLVLVEGGQWCLVEDLRADCDGATVVGLLGGRDHSVRNVRSRGGALSVSCCQDCRMTRNLVEETPGNAMGGHGHLPPSQQRGTRYMANTIRGWNRLGLEEYNPYGAAGCVGAMVRDNAFLGTGGAIWYGTIPVGFAISVIGSGALIQANWVEDGVFAGIEATAAGTRIVNNTITWPRGVRDHDSGMHVNSSDPTPGVQAGAAVAFNGIKGGVAGVLLAASPFVGTVTVLGNLVADAFIGLCLQGLVKPSATTGSESKLAFANAIAMKAPSGLRWTTPSRYWTAVAIAVDGPSVLTANLVEHRAGSAGTLLEEPQATLVGNSFGAALPPSPSTGQSSTGKPVGAFEVLDGDGRALGLVPVFASSF